jgi:hypothetical protein
MKLLQKAGAIASLVFVAVGFYWLWQPGTFSQNQIKSILGLLCAVAVSLGLYVFHLRDRIAALEKRREDR